MTVTTHNCIDSQQMEVSPRKTKMTKAELARQLGVSRTHITLLAQGKRKLSRKLADRLADILAGTPNTKSDASNPLGGANNVFGGFDSHTLPPIFFGKRYAHLVTYIITMPPTIKVMATKRSSNEPPVLSLSRSRLEKRLITTA